jgi:hypothetical protein
MLEIRGLMEQIILEKAAVEFALNKYGQERVINTSPLDKWKDMETLMTNLDNTYYYDQYNIYDITIYNNMFNGEEYIFLVDPSLFH